eukprot:m.378495 g.378495  ORF g.378495 m.378495 type:complete len:72 (+) comp20931_c0_seq7:1688-1903(+)
MSTLVDQSLSRRQGTLDFPPVELGFGSTQPTDRHAPFDVHQGMRSGADHTVGNNNTVTRCTLRRFGEMGIL